jgi:hypothetical protein
MVHCEQLSRSANVGGGDMAFNARDLAPRQARRSRWLSYTAAKSPVMPPSPPLSIQKNSGGLWPPPGGTR